MFLFSDFLEYNLKVRFVIKYFINGLFYNNLFWLFKILDFKDLKSIYIMWGL